MVNFECLAEIPSGTSWSPKTTSGRVSKRTKRRKKTSAILNLKLHLYVSLERVCAFLIPMIKLTQSYKYIIWQVSPVLHILSHLKCRNVIMKRIDTCSTGFQLGCEGWNSSPCQLRSYDWNAEKKRKHVSSEVLRASARDVSKHMRLPYSVVVIKRRIICSLMQHTRNVSYEAHAWVLLLLDLGQKTSDCKPG